MQENHLAKWLSNELSEAELAEFKNSEAYASYERIIQAADSLEAPEFDAEKAFAAIQNKRMLNESKVVQLHPFRTFMKVAAAIIILMTGSYFYINSLDENIVTQYAESKELILPDHSEVTLNANSELSYSKKNWNEHRNLSLKGEAFFKVAKGKRFTVATASGTVTVLGTQFNVENRKDFFEVNCYEGLVLVTFKGKETKIPAGNSFLVIDDEIVTTQIEHETQPSWMNAESTFKSVPLHFVLDEFQRQHNITVETKDVDLNELYTGTFSNTDSELALQSICASSRIKFKLEGRKVLFYGESSQ